MIGPLFDMFTGVMFIFSSVRFLKPSDLSKHLKGHQVIGLDLRTSTKLAVRWIILKWYYVEDLILDSIWTILVFYCKVSAFKIIYFCIVYFQCFLSGTKKTNIEISSFQNGVNNHFSSTAFYLKSKDIEGSLKEKNIF